ncbi:hypothetical protein ACFXPX_23740 [Kitasatospora sp. NPDC059146]|uniref:hypothetical protein n=1 Tax=Kitasatospora sp. NPDC059146 TaxID=3346741 RepID=UPI0036978D4A
MGATAALSLPLGLAHAADTGHAPSSNALQAASKAKSHDLPDGYSTRYKSDNPIGVTITYDLTGESIELRVDRVRTGRLHNYDFTMDSKGILTVEEVPNTQELADGYVADVHEQVVSTRTGKITAYTAKIHDASGKIQLTLTNPGDSTGRHGHYSFALASDGKVTATKLAPGDKGDKGQPGDKKAAVTPKGGVKAGAEGVGTGDSAELVYGGAGAAAVGAAGLGFVLLWRGRSNV